MVTKSIKSDLNERFDGVFLHTGINSPTCSYLMGSESPTNCRPLQGLRGSVSCAGTEVWHKFTFRFQKNCSTQGHEINIVKPPGLKYFTKKWKPLVQKDSLETFKLQAAGTKNETKLSHTSCPWSALHQETKLLKTAFCRHFVLKNMDRHIWKEETDTFRVSGL